MKKTISFLIIITILLSLAALHARAAVTEEDGIIALMKELEIMQGDENGDMMLDKKVSRAEFAKIAIAASSEKNSVAVGLRQSPFRDVPYTTWYAPYVKASVSAGYVVGYLDATFRPENTVTYEEAATIMLRVLGYDDTAFQDAYPYGQLSKAQGLELLDDVGGEMGDQLTRRQVMRMVYNALGADMNGGNQLVSVHDCAIKEDTDIIVTANEDDSLGADKVFTSAGTYNKGTYFDDNSAGMTGDIYVKNGKDIVSFIPDNSASFNNYETYFIYSVLSNSTIVGYRNGYFEEIDIPASATVYKNQTPSTYAAVKSNLEMGDTLYVKRTQNGSVDYVTYDSNNLKGPVKVTDSGWRSEIGANGASKVFRNGQESDASAVTTNDIIYYSAPLDVVFAYTDKVTGVYQKATPTKDSPEKIIVSGEEYTIESVEAFNELSSSGAFKYGDTVTLLLGRTGEVAGVAGTGSASKSTTASEYVQSSGGYVIETGKKDFQNADGTVYSGYYAKIVSADGSVNEYETGSDYQSFGGGCVNVTFKNGKAMLSRFKSNDEISGKFNASKGMLGIEYLSDDISILDTSGTSSDEALTYTRVYPQRLDGVTISPNSVRYYKTNSAGEISELILNEVTGDMYTYGIILRRDKTTGAYTADIDGTQTTYANTGLSASTTGPHRLKIAGGLLKNMRQLTSYSGYITSLTRTEAVIASKTYKLSDDVVVYYKPDFSTYMKITLDDAINGDYRLTAYYDKSEAAGGRIRIITAQKK